MVNNRPIRVTVEADVDAFVANMDEAVHSLKNLDPATSSAEAGIAAMARSMDVASEVTDFMGGEIGRVGAGLTGMGDRLTEINPEWEAMGTAISEAGKNLTFLSDAADVATGVMNLSNSAIQLMSKSTHLMAAANKVAAVAQWALNAAFWANPITWVVAAVVALVGALIWFFTQTEIGIEIWGNFTAFLTDAWQKFTTFMGNAWNKIVGFFTNAAATVISTWDAVQAWFADLPNQIKAIFASAVSWLVEGGRNILQGLWNGAKNIWTSVWGWIKDIPNQIKRLFDGAKDWLRSAGSALVTGLWNGIHDKLGWILDKISGFCDDVENWFKKKFGVSSPSTHMADIGEWLSIGLAKGIDKEARQVDAAMGRLAGIVGGTEFTRSLAAEAIRRGGTVLVLNGGIEVGAATAQEETVIAEFVAMLQRKMKAGV